jgi:hypothetical protein
MPPTSNRGVSKPDGPRGGFDGAVLSIPEPPHSPTQLDTRLAGRDQQWPLSSVQETAMRVTVLDTPVHSSYMMFPNEPSGFRNLEGHVFSDTLLGHQMDFFNSADLQDLETTPVSNDESNDSSWNHRFQGLGCETLHDLLEPEFDSSSGPFNNGASVMEDHEIALKSSQFYVSEKFEHTPGPIRPRDVGDETDKVGGFSPEVSEDKGPFPCEYDCNKTFGKRYLRNKHYKASHNPYSCPYCPKGFAVMRDL